MKKLYFLLAAIFFTVYYCRSQKPLIVTIESALEKGKLSIFAQNITKYDYTIELNFSAMFGYTPIKTATSDFNGFVSSNSLYYATVTAGSKTKIVDLESQHLPTPSLKYTYRYFKGLYTAEPDYNFVYLFPIGTGKEIDINRSSSFVEKILNQNNSDLFSLSFRFKNNDTLCAIRSGTVAHLNTAGVARKELFSSYKYNSTQNKIEITQRDGTTAGYQIIDSIVSLVKEGDRVIAGQPIAVLIAKNNRPQGLLSVFYLDRKKIEQPINDKIPLYSTVRPYFLTETGPDTLTMKQTYTSVQKEEYIIKELSKKEIKKYTQSKH